MKKSLLLFFLGLCCWTVQTYAQAQTVTGKVTSAEDRYPLPGVTVKIKGTTTGTQTDATGGFSIRAVTGQVLVFSFIGTVTQEISVSAAQGPMNVALKSDTKQINEVVVTALGQTVKQRALGTSQQSVKGADIAGTQRENFINSLQGRIAGVEVTSTSGVPGASTSITIRGVSSISSNNSPLFIVDGLPIDNKTLNTGAFYSDVSSTTALSNRGIDFTNRAADINPEDIESLVVLKGPEAAALYGIDAANGAIVITTKRGKPGEGRIDYSNSFRIEHVNGVPQVQHTYAPGTAGNPQITALASSYYEYFGPEYPAGTQLYDNVKNFFQDGHTQKHNLSFSGGTDRSNYRVATSYTGQNGVVPNSIYNKLNVTGATQSTVTKWLKTDLSMSYEYAYNRQPLKGGVGPLLGLLDWPQTDDAANYLTPAGTRRLSGLGTLGSGEVDNPYFSVNKNLNTSKNNRFLTNLGLTITPFKWLNIKTNAGVDAYNTQYLQLRHPESAIGFSRNGLMDVLNDQTRNISIQNLVNLTPQKLIKDLSIDATLGNSILSQYGDSEDGYGENFLDPNFISLNNTLPTSRGVKSTISQRRLYSYFGRATLSYKDYLYLTGTIRNDHTSTIPYDKSSFYYPSVSASFVFTDAFSAMKKYFYSGKLRAAYAQVGKDARPYSYAAALESKLTTGGGYGYGFYGPNPALKPEFAKSYEIGAELSWLQDRLGLDVTVFRKTTTDQIVNDIRGSYATGFILFNLNGAATENKGIEITLRGTPVKTSNFTWNATGNFYADKGTVTALPNALPESYVSDTWLYNNVRNGNTPGHSTRSLTGLFYLRNNQGQILISPSSGLPIRSTTFFDAGYDRNPNFTFGLSNNFQYKNFSLSFLLDFRKGGDVLDATDHYLTTLGLSPSTLDRKTSRIIPGVLQDGKENSATPTANNIVVTPYYQNAYYTSMSEELFIQKNINWIRMRDVTLAYQLPQSLLRKQNFLKNASVFVTATDLFLITNYKGLDPVVNGNTAAVGGSGAGGIDYGNFPMPIGLNFGVKIGL
ncbi:SusC/RagA family TonB-linked outer membrane protein [Mucilaginibacter mali]|uniref:SusC/RagA family TonB-linked outer membrane protein n=1 Tax=Mucilaginibacter mali TaxID=2740462 RepID=A0A7D4PSA0_9SPHI|nr:SusC/RagA family TonB-linked outer membrane protein [Mucilaginibacter mali]QKJ28863.1 SusC/RagA family TonB-linked outer membrane protein [Mucilaginibacter mali]